MVDVMKEERHKSNTEQILNKFGESCGEAVDNIVGWAFMAFVVVTCVIFPIIGLIILILE